MNETPLNNKPIDDTLQFAEDEDTPRQTEELPPWKVLVVDDDEDIHAATRFALRRLEFDGRDVALIHALSAAEALAILTAEPDIAVALVDVVMETETAGLDAARAIREDLGNPLTRIILRTGQPGMAPERQVIADYDINGYLDKTEATVDRLHTAVLTAIRSHRDLKRLDDAQRGLRSVIAATAGAFAEDSLAGFASSALRWLSGLMGRSGGVDGPQPSGFATDPNNDMRLTAATGRFADKIGLPMAEVVTTDIALSLENGQVGFRGCDGGPTLSAVLSSSTGARDILYIERAAPVNGLEQDLLSLFTANLAIAHDNLHLRSDARDGRREMVSLITRAIERHDPAMGFHHRRVAECSRILWDAVNTQGAPESANTESADTVAMAAGLHDIGMIAVPTDITNSTDPLGAAAWRVIRAHCRTGHEILKASAAPQARLGAIIALTHHERWDGRGYPDGLTGNAIPLAGRLVALVDCLDALLSPRTHRPAWSVDQALEHITKQRGAAFDPDLVDILLNHLDAIHAVRHRLRDDARRTDPQ